MPRAVALAALVTLAPATAPAQAPAGDLVAGGGAIVTRALASCETDLHTLNQIAGWQVRWPTALESQPVETVEDRTRAIELWSGA